MGVANLFAGAHLAVIARLHIPVCHSWPVYATLCGLPLSGDRGGSTTR